MKHLKLLSKMVATLCGVAIVSTALAAEGTHDPGVNARQRAEHERIQQGVRSGELTRGETKTLRQEEKSLRVEERAYKSDGKLTTAERKDLHQDANQVSKDIYREKHDGEVRPSGPLPPARAHDPVVNGRQRLQHDRIAQGVRSGQLTKEETAKLHQEEKGIRQEERVYRADGKLTPAERKDLHQDLNQASKDIYQEKHDNETRPGTAPAPTPVK
jgi:lactam utilization protein B